MPHAAPKRRFNMKSAGICLASALVLTLLSVLLSAVACQLEVVDLPRARWDDPWKVGPVSRSARDIAEDYELRQDYGFPFACVGYQRYFGWRPMGNMDLLVIDRSMKPVEFVRARYFASELTGQAGASAEERDLIESANVYATEVRARMRWRCSWLGLISNFMIYALMLSSAVGLVRFVRRRLTPKNACRRCRYPYEGLPTLVCPECGEPRS